MGMICASSRRETQSRLPQNWSSDSDIWSEPDRQVALQRMGVSRTQDALSPFFVCEVCPVRPSAARQMNCRAKCGSCCRQCCGTSSSHMSSFCHQKKKNFNCKCLRKLQKSGSCFCQYCNTSSSFTSALDCKRSPATTESYDPSRHSRDSRISWSSDQLAPSLVQGLLEVLRRTERSGQKLCSELETFRHSHLYKLLVEEILHKLKKENLSRGSVPGQEWIEVSQELEAFHRKSREVIQVAAVSRGWLKQGLEHLTRKCLSTKTLLKETGRAKHADVSDSPDDNAVNFDRTWVRTTVDAHRQLAQVLEEQVRELGLTFGGDESRATWADPDCGRLVKVLSDMWERGDVCPEESSRWYNDKFQQVPQALSLLQQTVQSMFCTLVGNLKTSKSTVKELTERLKMMEANQMSRLKELRQVQEMNQTLRAKETKVGNSDEIVQNLTCQLKAVQSEFVNLVARQQTTNNKISSQNNKIEELVADLESEKGTVQRLKCMLEGAYSELRDVQERENKISVFLNEAVCAKSQLETTTADLKKELGQLEIKEQELMAKVINRNEEIQKLTIKSETNEKILNELLAEAETKLIISESKEFEMSVRIENQVSEIAKLSMDLDAEKRSVCRLDSDLNNTMAKLTDAVERGTVISGLKDKAVEAQQKLEAHVVNLESKMQKQNFKKYKQELKSSKDSLEEALLQSKKSEERCAELQKELTDSQAKFKMSEAEWTQKFEDQQREQSHIRKQMKQACQTIETQSRECSEATSKATKLDRQLKQTCLQLDETKKESENYFRELEETLFKLHLRDCELTEAKEMARKQKEAADRMLRSELKTAKNKLDTATREVQRLEVECQKLQKCLPDKVPVREVVKPAKELSRRDKEMLCDSFRCQQSSQVHDNKGHKGSHLTEAEMKWKVKIAILEKEAARLRQELQKSYHSNQNLVEQVNNYEKNISATLQKPSASRSYNHSLPLGQSRCKQGSGGMEDTCTGSSDVSSSNPATSSEELCASSQSNSTSHHKFQLVNGVSSRLSVVSKQEHSDRSVLNSTAGMHLDHAERDQERTLDSLQDQDIAKNDGKNLLFKYGCSLVPILVPASSDTCSGDAKDSGLQRSNYSSPDLGIESDPCYVSSYSSSASSSESCPPPNHDSQQQQQRSRICSRKGHHRTDVSSQTEILSSFFPELEKAALSNLKDFTPELMRHGMCPLQDMEHLHQALIRSLVSLQQMKSTLSSRLDSKENLEYVALDDAESCCQRILDYVNGWKKSTNDFQTSLLTTAALGPKSSQTCLSSPVASRDSSQQSVPSSIDTVCYNAIAQNGNDDQQTLKTQVLDLQTKLQDLEELHRRAVEEITANKTKNQLMNRVLEKQLSATTKVLMKAKVNLKQNESLMYKQFEAITNKCS